MGHLAGITLLLLTLPAADGPPTGPAPPGDEPRLVFFAPRQPLLIAVQLQIDGTPIGEVRRAYAAQLFRTLDRNGDESLDAEEAERVPPPEEIGGQPTLAFAGKQFERAAQDGLVSADEFARYVLDQLGTPLEIRTKPLTATQSVDLLGALDTDGDGRLARGELEAARQTLRKSDLDQDETFAADELMPFGGPDPPDGGAMPAEGFDVPFRPVPDRGSLDELVAELQKRYADADDAASGLNREQLGLDEAAFARHDGNADGRLEADELAQFVRHGAPHVRVLVVMPNRQPVRPKVRLVQGDGPAEQVEQTRGSELSMMLAGIALTLRARVPLTTSYDARQFYRLRFRMADADGNRYLGEDEFAALSLPGADFAALDADGDGMLFEKELVAYLDRQADQSRNRVVLTVASEGESVFERFDTNDDRRLSPRELQEAARRLSELDVTGDGRLAAGELAGRYELSFEPGTTAVPDSDMPAAAQDGMAPQPARLGGTDGPDWFRNMDYNRDGDLTPREFLGPLDDFRKLDADGDGLIAPDEAERAGG